MMHSFKNADFAFNQVVFCNFSAEPHHVAGRMPEGNPTDRKLEHKKFDNLCVVVTRVEKIALGERLLLMPSSIQAKLRDGSSVPAIGVLFTINASQSPYYSDMKPSILTGVQADPSGLMLPAGCAAIFVFDYKGPVSELGGADSVSLAMGFPPEIQNNILSVEIQNG